MKITRSSLLVTILAVAAPACGNRLLVGQDPDGGPPTGAAGTGNVTTGAAGTGNVTTGAAGTGGPTTGAGGTGNATTGAGGTGALVTRPVTPLRVSGEEAVTRLAGVIWKALPDEDLLAQARLGRFTTTEDLYGPVRQLLADARARTGVGAFYRWWLDLDRLTTEISTDPALRKDQQLFPGFTPALAGDMAIETETFSVNVTLDPNGTYQTLMTAPFTFANDRLAAIYGVAAPTGLPAFQKIQLDPQQRAGLLTQPALQTLGSYDTRTAPSHRGAQVLEQFLCKLIPPPPANVEPTPEPTTGTTRQWLEMVAGATQCAPCHAVMDPPGLAFEGFDAIGRGRTMDRDLPIDVSNLEIKTLSPPRTVNGPVELAKNLSVSAEAQECMVRQWLKYALQRDLTTADNASVAQATATFRTTGFNLKELIFAVLTTDAFLKP